MQNTTVSHRGASYRLSVDGQGPPLLLVHGIGPGTTARANFASVWDALRARWTVYAPDLLGFGASDPPQGHGLDLDAWVDQLAHVIDQTGETEVCVLGQSIGGTLALRLAARDRRVAALVTSGAAGGMTAAPAALRRFWNPPSDRTAFAGVLAESFHDPSMLTEEQIDQRFTLMQSGARDKFLALIDDDPDAAVARTRLTARTLAAVACPVLLIHGRDDRQVPFADNASYLYDALPSAHLLALARCGHNPLREQPAVALAAAVAHLRGS